MTWWGRDRRRLTRARRELEEAHDRTEHIDEKVTAVEQRAKGNNFALRFEIALGGRGRAR